MEGRLRQTGRRGRRGRWQRQRHRRCRRLHRLARRAVGSRGWIGFGGGRPRAGEHRTRDLWRSIHTRNARTFESLLPHRRTIVMKETLRSFGVGMSMAIAAALAVPSAYAADAATDHKANDSEHKELAVGDPAPAWEGLVGVDDQKHSLDEHANAKAVVV